MKKFPETNADATAATAAPKILDNRGDATLGGYLNAHLPNADVFRLVSAYFSVYGYHHLADALAHNPKQEVKFLFGDPASVADTTTEKKKPMKATVGESGVDIRAVLGETDIDICDALRQGAIAKKCAEWVKRKNVQIRTVAKSNFLHGKMYLMQNTGSGGTAGTTTATVGSSNFTQRGLGASQNPNIEINVAITDAATQAALTQWFDDLWQNSTLTKDAKKQLLSALARWHEDYPPEFVYFKTLYEIFREEIEKRIDEDKQLGTSSLAESAIWKELYPFQKDAAKTVINRLRNHNGCILADSVGLGKTYTALAVIKYFELQNKNVLVLCPKRLEDNWQIYQFASRDDNNPFKADHFDYAQLAHTDLPRESGKAGSIKDLSAFTWSEYDVVVIDESHNFRNLSKPRKDDAGNPIGGGRYHHLMEKVLKHNPQIKVLMLSATPVNTSLTDLQNQIYLITKQRDETFADTLGVAHIGGIIKEAQKKFQAWEQQHNKTDKKHLLSEFSGDFIRLLGGITVARSRRQITQFYTDRIKFPKHAKPVNLYPDTDTDGEKKLSYAEMHKRITEAQFRIYQPSAYVLSGSKAEEELRQDKKEHNINQETREKCLVAMMRINFLKRLESSAFALQETFRRTAEKMQNQITRIEKFSADKKDTVFNPEYAVPEESELNDDDEYIVGRKKTYHLRELDAGRWQADIRADLAAIRQADELIRQITPERDAKLVELRRQIRAKAANKNNRKMLVFTAFADTATYLYEQTEKLATELGIKIAKVGGSTPQTQVGKNHFSDILTNFSPRSRKRHGDGEQIDILFATDCISEGQNLQDCDTVLNYDIHWNPVRLIQRFGRIDRIGSQNPTVSMINFWPPEKMDFYLKLEARVQARMALVDAVATGDDNLLDEQTEAGKAIEQKVQLALNFRSKEMEKMKNEIPTWDEQPDTLQLGDLTYDYFITQLIRYLEENRDKLDATPPGIHAVTAAQSAAPGAGTAAPAPAAPQPASNIAPGAAAPGAIFVFRHKNPPAGSQNPTHPHYLVYVTEDGKIRHGYTHARTILRLFETLTAGKTEANTALSAAFAAAITGVATPGKAQYDAMAKSAIRSIQQTFTRTSMQGISSANHSGGTPLPTIHQQPDNTNLELITWLIISKEN